MANIMSMSNVRNKVHRSGFDLSGRNLFTAKVGELLPIMTKEVIPGDKFKISLDTFTRTMPVNTAAFTRLLEYYDFFFVPNRLLWDKWPAFIAQTNQPFHASSYSTSANVSQHPYFVGSQLYQMLTALAVTEHNNPDSNFSSIKAPNSSSAYNDLGFSRYESACKLLQYLGYGPVKANLEARFKGYHNNEEYSYDWSNVPFGYVSNPYIPSTGVGEQVQDQALNPFPLLAYQKIYQDYYRFDQWERRKPYLCNLDYMMSNDSDFQFPLQAMMVSFHAGAYDPTSFSNSDPLNTAQGFLFDMRYANYKKDLFTGVLPSPQFGDTAMASPISGTLSTYNDKTAQIYFKNEPVSGNNTGVSLQIPLGGSTTAGISVFALRQAEFLQKWREITQSGKQDYADQLAKHWDVRLPSALSDCVQWLNGVTNVVNINAVVNTNLSTGNSADLHGNGVGRCTGKFEFEAKEHGILMCIYHATPLLDYENVGLDRLCTKTTVGAYAIPEFDSLGMESVRVTDVLAQNIPIHTEPAAGSTTEVVSILGEQQNAKPLGYAPRYIEYKTSRDLINGAFLDTLRSWAAPLTAQSLFKRIFDDEGQNALRYNAFKVSPDCTNEIFLQQVDKNYTLDEDSLMISANISVGAVRNLSRDGLPY